MPAALKERETMARTTISLPDELVAKVKQHDDLNVSAICRQALEEELRRRGRIDELVARSSTIEIKLMSADLVPAVLDVVSFEGRRLGGVDDDLPMGKRHTDCYLTAKGRFAFVVNEPQKRTRLESFDSLDQAEERRFSKSAIVAAGKAIGETRARQLDI